MAAFTLRRGGPGTVIVPTVGWATSYSPFQQYGWKLVFVDIDRETLNYDVRQLRAACRKYQPACILAVNLLGNPNDFDEFPNGIPILEDNCESMGARYNGRVTGSFGEMGTHSTFFSHHICTMEGGMVTTNDEHYRDMLLALRQRADVANTLLFFLVVVTMVPLGVGPEINTLRTIAPGVVWVAALLAAILSLNRLFAADYADGTLEQMVLSGEPLPVVVLAKTLAHWLTTGVPITVMAVLLGVMFDLPADAIGVLVASLVLGTPALSLIGAVGAALTLGLRGGGVLITLLVLPLYVPVLIFGAGAVEAVAGGLVPRGQMLLLGALSIAATVLAPWAIAAALRISLE